MAKHLQSFIVLVLIAILPTILSADAPQENTIPIIGMLLNEWQLTPELLCDMSWKYFDGVECNYYISQENELEELAAMLEQCGFYIVLDPLDLHELEEMGSDSCRGRYASLTSQNAFIEVDEDGDAITGTYSASTTEALIENISADVVDTFDDFEDLIWFYRFFDEPASNQRHRMYNATYSYDDFFPSYLTADTTIFRADSAGTYSWIKYWLEQADSSQITSTVFAGGPRIYPWNDWAFAYHDADVPDAHGRAEIIRGFCNMNYQPISGSVLDNSNDLVMIDAYPFRHVGSIYQDSMAYTPALGDSLNMWLLDHMEEALDSTFLAARESNAEVLFWSQAIGICGGPRMWEETQPDDWDFDYDSYLYRFPSPAELRMQINLALLRQAKGLMPFCLATYFGSEEEGLYNITTGLLDTQMIPFDAPFEEWAYTGRLQDSLYFVRPDLIAPFMSGFDPLYAGPGMPPGTSGQQHRQDFLEWKFTPYGRLWNALPNIFEDATVMAPELAELYWYEGYEDAASIACVDDTLSWMTPVIKVFTDDEAEGTYAFYVNRNCRDASDIYTVCVSDEDLGWTPVIALDHSRRFFIPGDEIDGEFFYDDTLEAGAARLVEYFPAIPYSSDPDLRITQPDVHLLPYGASIGAESNVFTVGDSISILTEIYNLGTEDASDIVVTLSDVTNLPYVEVDRDTLEFDGLSVSGYSTDADTAALLWIPGTGSDGLRRLGVTVAAAPGEEETSDNSVTFPVLIEPVDFATKELHDPWDMEEATGNPPDWYTNDIVDVELNWDESGWTDSVSGVFEGVLEVPDPLTDPFRGEILLLDENETLDADTYTMVSLAGVCNNPNSSNPSNGCGFFLFWRDDHEQQYYFNLANNISPSPGLGDGWDQWKVFEPYDLSGVTGWDDDIHDLRLRFQTNLDDPVPLRPGPIDIRLGWFRITE